MTPIVRNLKRSGRMLMQLESSSEFESDRSRTQNDGPAKFIVQAVREDFAIVVRCIIYVEMYDPIGHFVYFESHGGFSYESGRKRNTAQATSSRARSC